MISLHKILFSNLLTQSVKEEKKNSIFCKFILIQCKLLKKTTIETINQTFLLLSVLLFFLLCKLGWRFYNCSYLKCELYAISVLFSNCVPDVVKYRLPIYETVQVSGRKFDIPIPSSIFCLILSRDSQNRTK